TRSKRDWSSDVCSSDLIFLIPVIMLFFAICGATWGMAEEVIPFILIAIPLAMMMGFDSITGTAMILVGVYAGFGAAFMNPFTVEIGRASCRERVWMSVE